MKLATSVGLWRFSIASRDLLLAGALVFCAGRVAAEERNAAEGEIGQPIFRSYFSAYSSAAEPGLTLASTRELERNNRLSLSFDDWKIETVFPVLDSSQSRAEGEPSILLFRKPVASRFSSHGWTGLRTGFGRYFRDDPIGRSRTNGAGIEEPDCLYLKMSLRF